MSNAQIYQVSLLLAGDGLWYQEAACKHINEPPAEDWHTCTTRHARMHGCHVHDSFFQSPILKVYCTAANPVDRVKTLPPKSRPYP
jgi:hypothetical protein